MVAVAEEVGGRTRPRDTDRSSMVQRQYPRSPAVYPTGHPTGITLQAGQGAVRKGRTRVSPYGSLPLPVRYTPYQTCTFLQFATVHRHDMYMLHSSFKSTLLLVSLVILVIVLLTLLPDIDGAVWVYVDMKNGKTYMLNMRLGMVVCYAKFCYTEMTSREGEFAFVHCRSISSRALSSSQCPIQAVRRGFNSLI